MAEVKRDERGWWIKGSSGNSDGRRTEYKRSHWLRELCRNDTDVVYRILMDIITNEEEKGIVRVNAIRFHQETAWGKAPQSITIDVNQDEQDITRMSSECLYLMAQGKVELAMRRLYENGSLPKYVEKFEKEKVKVIEKKE